MRLIIILFISLNTLFSLQTLASVTATVDRTTINSGQSIRLNINSDDAGGRTPNLTRLNRDFSVIGSSKVNRPYIKNGQRKQQSLWFYILRPKRSGNLTIPAITVNKEKTKAIKVKVIARKIVVKKPQKLLKKDDSIYRDIIIKGTIDKTKVYPNEMLTYTLNINYPTSNQITNDNIIVNTPFVANAVILPLSPPHFSETTLRGKQRTVRVQSYAIFSEQVALYQIEPASIRFKNESDDKASPIRANQLHFEVRAKANQNSLGYWLPTTNLTVNEEWQASNDLQPGSTIKRIIEIKALGLNAEVLPLISPLNHDNIDVKLENIEVENRVVEGELVAIRRETISMTFKQEGNINIGPIDIHWWNTKANQARITTIAPQSFTVRTKPIPLVNNKNIDQLDSETSTLTNTIIVDSIKNQPINENNNSIKGEKVTLLEDDRIGSLLTDQRPNWLIIILCGLLITTTLGWLISLRKKKNAL